MIVGRREDEGKRRRSEKDERRVNGRERRDRKTEIAMISQRFEWDLIQLKSYSPRIELETRPFSPVEIAGPT